MQTKPKKKKKTVKNTNYFETSKKTLKNINNPNRKNNIQIKLYNSDKIEKKKKISNEKEMTV